MNDLRHLPAVDQLLGTADVTGLVHAYGRPLVVDAIRSTLAGVRAAHQAGDPLPDEKTIVDRVSRTLAGWLKPTLQAVINASGVVLHTNLGRAPLSRAALQAIQDTAGSYTTLEFELESGKRGSRAVHAEQLLARLTGAPAALVVNNNAAAVLLALTALAKRRRAIISRTQLVEIGGGFRIPEVMAQSGAKLVEVGATNRVHLADYEAALDEPAALVVRAHHSNFRIIGFTAEPAFPDLVTLSHRFDVPVLDDLGSGALLDTARYGLSHEPMVQESLAAAADLVCFSGDKLLGGPQAGIIVGRADLLAKIKKHPLARAVRADKLQLAALAATLEHYLKDEAEREIPIWRMISAHPEAVRARACAWLEQMGQGEAIPTVATIGGGSLPEETLPSFALALDVPRPDRFLARLRQCNPPVIARVDNDRVLLDPRTVLPEQDPLLLNGLKTLL
ncbi:MAG TPA: L-seryl-tRNA(Sec) selenium transferase [Anaerolineaceae bacterium]|nr:L-seryl-tRNA(Sec) selenium transferase [Anaerolineaceae bacterium]